LLPARRERTRQGIVQAAQRLFAHYGFRRTTMEEIGRAAGVAKATLYAYFPDKEQALVAVVEAVTADLEAEAVRRAQDAASPREAVASLLREKFGREWAVLNESTHAAELLAASEGLARPQLEQAKKRFLKLLGEQLRRAGTPAGESRALAETLYLAFDGLVRGSSSSRELERRATLLLDRVLPR
jgi:AcrR family transcriptional regulator